MLARQMIQQSSTRTMLILLENSFSCAERDDKGSRGESLYPLGKEETSYQETSGQCTKKGENDGADSKDGYLCGEKMMV